MNTDNLSQKHFNTAVRLHTAFEDDITKLHTIKEEQPEQYSNAIKSIFYCMANSSIDGELLKNAVSKDICKQIMYTSLKLSGNQFGFTTKTI